jgi:DNA polymerase IIIc chi subunit
VYVNGPQFWLTLVAIVVAIVVPIGLAVHTAGRARSDKNIARLDKHIDEALNDHAATHERLARLEIQVQQHDAEIRSLRERWHQFRDQTMKDAWQLFQNWKNEMYEHFRRERDE